MIMFTKMWNMPQQNKNCTAYPAQGSNYSAFKGEFNCRHAQFDEPQKCLVADVQEAFGQFPGVLNA